MVATSHADDFKLLGTFLKTHGIGGHMILKLTCFQEEELQKDEPVFVEIDGIPVPFFIFSFRFLSDDSAMVKLDEINSSKDALFFVNHRLFIEKQTADEESKNDSEGYDNLAGFSIVDEKLGPSGILQEIITLPDNPVMRIDLDGREILVPFHENIVREINHKLRIVKISAPEGLFDLYL